MAEWFRRDEYKYLLSVLADQEREAMEAFVGCDAKDPALVGRIQATVKLTRMFLDGSVKEGIMQELKERENG